VAYKNLNKYKLCGNYNSLDLRIVDFGAKKRS
jgi:hypothetical protein